MNQQMVDDLQTAFRELRNNRKIRGIVISGADGTFCAGGDIKEMQDAYASGKKPDAKRTEQFDHLLTAVNTAPQVIVTKVEGVAMGGGFGLVCVSDIAIASEDAMFGMPEVRLGILPALISPYVIERVGISTARRLMLTGARFNGIDAARYGVVNEAYPTHELDDRVSDILADIHECSPLALAACKRLIFHVNREDVTETAQFRAELLDEMRHSIDGQEGMLAFIQKRKPKWAKG
jgi:isohexenylglutaconyl-CoA hydratase